MERITEDIMKLTYRGVDYTSLDSQIEAQSLSVIPRKYRLSRSQDSNVVILTKPVSYYTYRGVSYIKNSVLSSKTRLLLDRE